jgi:hypothetical protein
MVGTERDKKFRNELKSIEEEWQLKFQSENEKSSNLLKELDEVK